jgi:probable rRNA maturation factor
VAVVEVINESGVDLDVDSVAAQVTYLLQELGLHDDTEVSMLFVGPERMAELHVEWMDLEGPTDVMSFPMDDLSIPAAGETAEPGILGDIVMGPQVAATQGDETGHGMTGEIELLVTHGVLHCLGMDHQELDEREVMFALQDDLLASWRVKSA